MTKGFAMNICIIGGGPSGVALAADLSSLRNAEIRVLEASSDIGGRAFTKTFTDGSFYDTGAQYIGPSQRPFKWAQRLGVDVVRVDKSSSPLSFEGKQLDDSDRQELLHQIDHAFRAVQTAARSIKLNSPWSSQALINGALVDIKTKSASQLLDLLKLPRQAHQAMIAIQTGCLGTNLENVSALMFLAQVKSQGTTMDDFVFKNGFSSLLSAMAQYAGIGKFTMNSEVTRIVQNSNFDFTIHSNDERYHANIVVVAVPTNVRKRIDCRFLAERNEVNVSSAAKFGVISSKAPNYRWGFSLSKTDFGSEAWSTPAGSKWFHCVFGSGSKIHEVLKSPEAMHEPGRRRLQQLLGKIELCECPIIGKDWTNDRWALGSYSAPSPGDIEILKKNWEAFPHSLKTKGFAVIGEDMSVDFGYVDGAFHSAEIAARIIKKLCAQ